VKTFHRVHIRDSRDMGFLPAASVDLVLTSPPYPMIGMWDEAFAALSPEVKAALGSLSSLITVAGRWPDWPRK
jgi:DNA modification methylase